MASCAPKSLSSASSVDIGSARTTCRPRTGSASGKVPELLFEAALRNYTSTCTATNTGIVADEGNRPRLSSVRFVCRHDRTSIYDSNGRRADRAWWAVREALARAHGCLARVGAADAGRARGSQRQQGRARRRNTAHRLRRSHMSELERDMQPLAEGIIAAPATSLAGLRAKALVALWEALPANASHDGAFDFPDASRSLFDAVAEMIGLMPMVREPRPGSRPMWRRWHRDWHRQ